MREIKFRAWNIIVHRMQSFTLKDLEEQGAPVQWHILKIDQCVCLKDRNKAEYYFNDIVKTPQGIGVLVWHYDRLGIASGEIGNYHAIDSVYEAELMQYEIIGNIHQHSELITVSA